MASSKFIKTKSNYVLKEKHQNTIAGEVFERDFMTISGAEGMSPDEGQTYRSSNFKFTVNSGVNQEKKHSNGTWLSSETTTTTSNTISNDSKIILNPDYESLTDFAYYGSAVNMVKSALVDIALRFPGELYFTDDEAPVRLKEIDGKYHVYRYGDSEYETADTYNLVSNPFNLDIYTNNVEVDDKLRYLTASYGNYDVIFYDSLGEGCSCVVQSEQLDVPCREVDDIGAIIAIVNINIGKRIGSEEPIDVKILVYKYKDDVTYLYEKNDKCVRCHIRPKRVFIDTFYDTLDDFEKVIISQDSTPRYTATFNTPFETEKGFFTYKVKYTWPSTYGWNPDLSGLGYETYVDSLIKLAGFHDEYDTDNIWRSMTHEAIKNLDWTFTKENGDDVDVYENIDTSRIEPILKLYGRQYDDLKRKIDNIARSSTVTLDKKNNVPDYFLDDTLNLAGWETTSLILDSKRTTKLYEGTGSGYDNVDANNEFLRRLKVFSPYILSLKGTTKGLETILSLFGFRKKEDDDDTGYDYTIDEFVEIAYPRGDRNEYPKYDDVVKVNKCKSTYDSNKDDLYGIPVVKVESEGIEPYVIPYFDAYERDMYGEPIYYKHMKYDGDLYFQMKGGWGAHEDDNGNIIYDETQSAIKIVPVVGDLCQMPRYIVKSNDICYVTDITGIYGYFTGDTGGASHYFKLVDDEYANSYGEVVKEDGSITTGWTIVKQTDIDDKTGDGARISYLESIKDDCTGNNPHTGNEYDGGKSYEEYMGEPFKYSIDNDDFIGYGEFDPLDWARKCSFSAETLTDNKKCEYFTNSINGGVFSYNVNADDDERLGRLLPCEKEYVVDEDALRDKLFNTEDGNKFDEPSSYSIINLKKIKIEFICQYDGENAIEEFSDFVKNKVMFYLKQMIPATTIFEYSITHK